MTYSSGVPRPRAWAGILTLVLAVSAVLAFANSASATTYTPANGPELEAAITDANLNPGADTIRLANGTYLPEAPMIISDDLTIASNPASQAPVAAKIDGAFVSPTGDMFDVAGGVNATFKGILITTSETGFSVIKVNGNLRFDNSALSGNTDTQLTVESGATAVFSNSTIDGGAGLAVLNSGTLTLNNTTVARNGGGGIDSSAGLLNLNNTIVFDNIVDCFAPANSTLASLDGDGTCGVAITGDPQLGPVAANGGPTPTLPISAGSPARNAGNNSICPPTVDQRYFVRTDGQCDIGSYEFGATRDTTAPTCVVTALRNGPPKQQDVTAQDTGSGLDADAISNVTISNGTVAFTPFAAPSRSGLVLTATKTNQAQLTQWSFTATDVAGNVKNCA